MALNTNLTANETKAALILVTECLGGMGGERPSDLEHDEYTWVDAKMLMAHGYKAPAANATFGALMAKGFIYEADKNEMALSTEAWRYLDTIWDASKTEPTEVNMAKNNTAKTAKSNVAAKGSKPSAAKRTVPAKSKAAKASGIDAAKPTGAIVAHKRTEEGNGVLVQASNGHSFVRPIYGDTAEFRKIAAIGQPYDAARKWDMANPAQKPQARLANGVDSRTAPHSAKAVADQKAAPKGKGKAAKPSAPKSAKAKQPSNGANRAYTKGNTPINANKDSWRYYMLTTIQSAKDTDSAKAKHAKSGKFADKKLDINWAASQGYIKFAK